jgi:porin
VIFNLPAFSIIPVTTWGVRVKAQPLKTWSMMTGVYVSDPRLGRESAHGVDFRIRQDAGAFVITEIGYQHNQGQGATGLPGNYKLGGYYDSSRFAEFAGPPGTEVRGNYGMYILLDQMVYREGGVESTQGMIPFAALTYAPRDRNTFPLFIMGGLVYRGLLPGRDEDTTAFGAAYGKFSNDLAGLAFELVLEWSHAFALTPWVTIQPDVQYILDPGGTGEIPDALVLGVQLGITL